MTAVISMDEPSRTHAMLAERPDLGTLVVTGSDRLTWLQGLVTCDVADLVPGTGCWGLVLTKPGKILADVIVVAGSDRVFLAVPRLALSKILEWFQHHLIMEDADIADVSSEQVWASLHGPKAAAVAGALARDLGGTSAAVDELTGLGDAVLMVPAARLSELHGTSRDDVRLLGADEWERLRIERALPLYGVDMTEEQNPHDVSLERRAVSWDKGCYLGQEAVCMQDMRGKVKRRLVLLSLVGAKPPPRGTPVLDASGATVGESRSAAASPSFRGAAALAVVRAEASAPGTRVSVGGVPGVVVVPDR